MSERFEAFLATIYVDAAARARFLADPHSEAVRAGLDEREIAAVEKIDRLDLQMAAHSLRHKRAGKQRAPKN